MTTLLSATTLAETTATGLNVLWPPLMPSSAVSAGGAFPAGVTSPEVLTAGDGVQMIWAHTRSLTTEMIEVKSSRLGAVDRYPSPDVSLHLLGTVPEGAVALIVDESEPRPAIICLVDLAPEPRVGIKHDRMVHI